MHLDHCLKLLLDVLLLQPLTVPSGLATFWVRPQHHYWLLVLLAMESIEPHRYIQINRKQAVMTYPLQKALPGQYQIPAIDTLSIILLHKAITEPLLHKVSYDLLILTLPLYSLSLNYKLRFKFMPKRDGRHGDFKCNY